MRIFSSVPFCLLPSSDIIVVLHNFTDIHHLYFVFAVFSNIKNVYFHNKICFSWLIVGRITRFECVLTGKKRKNCDYSIGFTNVLLVIMREHLCNNILWKIFFFDSSRSDNTIRICTSWKKYSMEFTNVLLVVMRAHLCNNILWKIFFFVSSRSDNTI